MRNKYNMAFESLEDGVDVPAGTEDVAAMQADAAQAEQVADIADVVEAVEDLAEGAEQMEGVAGRMEDSLADGGEGYAPEAAAEATAALESLYKRIGLKAKAMPALESFGGRNSRRSSTEYAVEGIKEQVKKVWAAIKKFFKDMWEKIKGYYASVFDGATKLKARAEAMTKKLEAETGAIVETTFEDSTIVNQFAINGVYKESNVLDIVGGAEALLAASNSMLHANDKVQQKVEDTISKFSGGKVDTTEAYSVISDTVNSVKGATGHSNPSRYGFDTSSIVRGWAKLLGDKEFVLGCTEGKTGSKIAGKDDEVSKSFQFRAIVGSTAPDNKEVKAKVTTAKIDEMFKITKAVSDLSQLCLDYKSNIAKVNGMAKSYDSIVTSAEKIAEASVDSKNPDIKAALADIKGIVKGVQSVMGKVATFPLSNAIATGNAALGFCGANLSHYGTK